MKNDNEWLTVLDIEKQIKIPNATIRRYIRNHGHHLNIKKKGKSYFLASESIPIVLDIRKQYDEGKSQEQVEENFIQKGNPVTITVNADDKQMTVNVGEALQDMKNAMHEQNKIIEILVEQIKRQQEYIDTKLEERDQILIAAIRANQESQKEVGAEVRQKKGISTGNKKWYRFWNS